MIEARAREGALVGQIVVTIDAPGGSVLEVRGATVEPVDERRSSWTVTQFAHAGGRLHVLDPLAPLGVPVVYTVTGSNGVVHTTAAVTRPFGMDADFITSWDGRRVVPFTRRPAQDDRPFISQTKMLEVPGRALPVPVWGGVARQGPTAITVWVEDEHKALLREIVAEDCPLVVLHNAPGCIQDGCDVRLAVLARWADTTDTLTAILRTAVREWQLPLQPIDMPFGQIAPAATWDDVNEHFASWAEVEATGMTWDELASGVWLTT